MTKKDEKSKAVEGYKLGEQCGPDNLDTAPVRVPDTAVAASYPTKNPQYSYNYETPTHKIQIQFEDGNHGPDRWNLSENQLGTPPDEPAHDHDDYKRPPPTTLDAGLDPKQFRAGFFANYRVPDSTEPLSQPGDKLGLTPKQRAAIKKPNEP
jgi:hypothetical protein